MINKPPYFSGIGWSAKFDTWVNQNLPQQYRASVQSEGVISWNRCGGSPSGHFYSALAKTVQAINAGIEPSFPNIEWNNRFLEAQKAARKAAYGIS